ncbi:heavy-metal-associated domain-containing protein [Devosia sp. PTR5]|uniref:Heavy-metal-associated domain-containing protein n=1 Tax=Devosia oryzisoli TaxID=2774138 RepID=A0A927FSC1_9HYPH|nr:heavy-metal-associated domain-containing protein [Devosia oryzisoli]MBD8065111.1 heavy-metal-associated domain-containing protein [Devosia oryzisoli]
MYNFTVADMTCGHCASTIEKAVKSADPAAGVSIDISARKVQVETTRSAQEIADAINSAGYSSTIAA